VAGSTAWWRSRSLDIGPRRDSGRVNFALGGDRARPITGSNRIEVAAKERKADFDVEKRARLDLALKKGGEAAGRR